MKRGKFVDIKVTTHSLGKINSLYNIKLFFKVKLGFDTVEGEKKSDSFLRRWKQK